MKIGDVILCAILAVIGAGAARAVLFPGHSRPDTLESPLFRDTLARSLNDFAASDTVLDPYATHKPAAKPPTVQPDVDAWEIFAKGIEQYQHARFEQAVGLFRQAVARQPGFVQAYHLLGDCLLSLGKNDEAFASYNAAIEIDPNNGASYHYLGNAHRMTGNDKAAEDAYLKVIELSPDDTRAHALLGSIHAARGENEKALAEYKHEIDRIKALAQREPDDPSHKGELAAFYIEHSIEQAQAMALLLEAIEARPDDPALMFLLARAHLAAGDNAKAVEIIESIIPAEKTPAMKQYYQSFLDAIRRPPQLKQP